jgi:hypothetical protein
LFVRIKGRGLLIQKLITDDKVKSPTSALRFIPLALRRTISTPHTMKFACLFIPLLCGGI